MSNGADKPRPSAPRQPAARPPAGSPQAGSPQPSDRPESEMSRLEGLVRQAIHILEQAKPMPLSTSSIINKEELLAVLQQALAALPEELRSARWILKERAALLARMQQEGEEIVASARNRAEQMVQRSEVARAAELKARKLVSEAEDRTRRMRLETEDWCDQKLAGFESSLQRMVAVVAKGRERLGIAPTDLVPGQAAEPAAQDEDDVFDQDLD